MITKVVKSKNWRVDGTGPMKARVYITWYLFGIIPVWYMKIVMPDGSGTNLGCSV